MKLLLLPLAAVAIISCSKGDNSPKPEETHDSMINLKAQDSSDCPDLSGTYSAKSPDKQDSTEEISFRLQKKGEKVFHLTEQDSHSGGFAQYILSKFMLDDDGFLVDGLVHDKTAGVREGINTLVRHLNSAAFELQAKVTGFDLEKEIKKMNLENINAGYVAHCSNNQLHMHYVIGNNAYKATFTKNADLSISGKAFNMEDGGAIVKQTDSLPLISKEIKAIKGPFDSIKDTATALPGDLMKTIGLNNPSTISFELMNRDNLILPEPIYMRFDRFGYFSGRHLYVYKKSFLGPDDDIWFDDVAVSFPWPSISINIETRKVYAGETAGQGEIIGDVLIEGSKYLININLKQSYSSRALDLKKH